MDSSSFAFFDCPLEGDFYSDIQYCTPKLCPISGAGYLEGCGLQKVRALKVLQVLLLLKEEYLVLQTSRAFVYSYSAVESIVFRFITRKLTLNGQNVKRTVVTCTSSKLVN